MDEGTGSGAASAAVPDVDALVAELRARVEERRRSGDYPPGLEDDLAEHFRRILRQNRDVPPLPDLRTPLAAAEWTLPLQASRIPLDSAVPGGEAVHRTIARVIGRQTQGILEQVQGFAQPAWETLAGLVTTVEALSRAVNVDIARHLDAIYERQAEQERAIAAAGPHSPARRSPGHSAPPADFRPWYSSDRFDDEFRGTREEIIERYRDVAARLMGRDPVLDIGCGRGEFLELLRDLGVEATGVEIDAERVTAAVERGLAVEHANGLAVLERLGDGSLGGLVLIQVVEHLSAQDVVDLVALAAGKLRSGGAVLIETVNPQSLYVYAHSFYVDPRHVRPVHPAYLSFLFREAGFAEVGVEWRSPPPGTDVLEPPGDNAPPSLATPYAENVSRLNRLLFAPQDYLLVAVR